MTLARGVSQTLRNTRHAAIDFRQDGKRKTQNINTCNIIFKILNVHLKESKLVPEQMTYYKTNIYYKMELTFLIKLMTQMVIDSRSQTGLYY